MSVVVVMTIMQDSNNAVLMLRPSFPEPFYCILFRNNTFITADIQCDGLWDWLAEGNSFGKQTRVPSGMFWMGPFLYLRS